MFLPCVILTGPVVMEKKNEMSIDYRQDDKNSRKKRWYSPIWPRETKTGLENEGFVMVYSWSTSIGSIPIWSNPTWSTREKW